MFGLFDTRKAQPEVVTSNDDNLLYRHLYDAISAQAALIRFEPDGTIVDANDNFLAAMDCRLNDIVGKHHRMFCDKETRESSEYQSFWQQLASGQAKQGQFVRYTPTGREVWLEASYCPVKDEFGNVSSVIKIASDITDIITDTHELKSQKDALSRSQAIIEFDLDGNVQTANENFLHTMHYSEDQIIGQHHSKFCSQQMVNSSEYKDLWARLRHGEFVSGKFERVDAHGNTIWLEASYNPIFDPKGRLYKVIKFATNITERVLRAQSTEQLAREASTGTEDAAQQGGRVVKDAIHTMERVVSGLTDASQHISDLNEQSDRIGNIVETITSIADQTNLLALNAAIEAARAGEQGRGFAVVADEVRQLAARTSASTAEIDEVVKRNQQLAGQATTAMEEVVKQSQQGSDLINQTGDSIHQINDSARQLMQALNQADHTGE